MTFAPPVRKKLRGGNHQPGDPLPIPVASLTGLPSSASSWNYYSGIYSYRDGVVVVNDLSHVASLWHSGYFGQLKNTNMQREDFGNEGPYKFQKRWELLKADGIKEASFFKRTIDLAGDCEDPESLPCDSADSGHELMETDRGPKDEKLREEERDSDEIKTANLRGGKDVKDPTSGSGNRNDSAAMSQSNSGAKHRRKDDRDVEEDCHTVLTFESDQISSAFFDDFDADTSSGHLELLLEEAMFLSYALGCLVVKKQMTRKGKAKEKEMTIDQMWMEFVNRDPKFAVRYAVYHYYRTKGWVVKSGLKFGADFVLYPVGPPFYHAQFTVMIQSIWSDNNERDSSLSGREMSWTSLAATERLNSHVKKMPLICYVLRPRSLTFQRLSNILCLQSMKIKEALLSRWDPAATNEPEKDVITVE